uniref:ATP synthase complex subunit 8 n=1 Tax=Extensus latus TaxID=3047931 RepID=A0A9Y1YS74_9HEMI|nr:ATP synthase F0 subunit 8 [Extensus latus]
MPQMSPMWWFSLMLYFIMLFTLFNSMIYFMFYKEVSNSYNLIKVKMTWKW